MIWRKGPWWNSCQSNWSSSRNACSLTTSVFWTWRLGSLLAGRWISPSLKVSSVPEIKTGSEVAEQIAGKRRCSRLAPCHSSFGTSALMSRPKVALLIVSPAAMNGWASRKEQKAMPCASVPTSENGIWGRESPSPSTKESGTRSNVEGSIKGKGLETVLAFFALALGTCPPFCLACASMWARSSCSLTKRSLELGLDAKLFKDAQGLRASRASETVAEPSTWMASAALWVESEVGTPFSCSRAERRVTKSGETPNAVSDDAPGCRMRRLWRASSVSPSRSSRSPRIIAAWMSATVPQVWGCCWAKRQAEFTPW